MKHYHKQLFSFIICLFFLNFVATSLVFAQKPWKVQISVVSFKIKNAGITVDGKFGAVEASIIFDQAMPEQSSISASIASQTIDTGIESRDNHLRKTEYLDATKHPKISIKSKKISKLANGTYEGFFDLTLKNTTKEVRIPFLYTENKDTATFKGEFTINRLDYSVGKSSWIMSDNITIKIELKVF